MSARRPSLPPMPDLAHLTEEERKIIESVLQRQREEEEREQEILRTLQDDFETYQASVIKLGEETKQVQYGQQGAVCEICHKTKFADGVGHKCHYCGVRSCARCGGKLNLRTNKDGSFRGPPVQLVPQSKESPVSLVGTTQVWSCNLCKKKQEILVKTGQWYHGGMAKPVQLDVDTGSDTSSIKADNSPPHEKKPKFHDRGQTDSGQSSEKENMSHNHNRSDRSDRSERGMSRTGSIQGKELIRQYSMSEVGKGSPHERTPDREHAHGRASSADRTRDRDRDRDRDRGRERDRGRPHDRGPPSDTEMSRPRGELHGEGREFVPPEETRQERPSIVPPGETRPVRQFIPPGETRPAFIPPGETRPSFIPPGETRHGREFVTPGETRPEFTPPGEKGRSVQGESQDIAQPRPQQQPQPQPTARDRHGRKPQDQYVDQERHSDDQRQAERRSSDERRSEREVAPGGERRHDSHDQRQRDLARGSREGRESSPLPSDDRQRDRPNSRERFRSGEEGRHREESRNREPRDTLDRRRNDSIPDTADHWQEPHPDSVDSRRIRELHGDRHRMEDRRGKDLEHDHREYRGYHDSEHYDRNSREIRRNSQDRMVGDLEELNRNNRLNRHSRYGQEESPQDEERRPERLMRGHAPHPSQKDMESFPQYSYSKPSLSGRRNRDRGHHEHGHEHDHGDFPEADQYPEHLSRQNVEHETRQHLDPSSAVPKTSRNRRKLESIMRNDSLSSDPSDCVRPPPPKPHKHKKGKKPRQDSLSSSDDEIQTTPECTSCDEPEIESESVSEKGIEPMYKTHGDFQYDRDERWRKDEILAAKIKKFLAHPVSWQPSADGTKLIGHMILRKSMEGDSGGALGLKVIGGKMTDQDYMAAFITKVKKGSIADTVGHLRPGDEVVEWNGRSLRGANFEEVYDIIFESKQEPQVELVVQRPITAGELPPGIPEHPDMEGYEQEHSSRLSRLKRPSVTITSPGSPGTTRIRPHSPQLCGKVQVKLFYDASNYQLIVTIVSATDLPPRDNGQTRNPYCKLYLLPDRSDKSKRRTKTVPGTLEPKWNQTFFYSLIKHMDIQNRALEITVYDYDRIGSGEYVGEVSIELANADLYEEPQYYTLRHHDETAALLAGSREGARRGDLYHKDHLSPPSSVARLSSDSDMSEFDLDDGLGSIAGAGLVGRGDGASVSSIGSSYSPPPGSEELSEPGGVVRVGGCRDMEPEQALPPSAGPMRHRAVSEGRDDMGRKYSSTQPSKLERVDPGMRRGRSPGQSQEIRGPRSRSKSPGRQRISDPTRSMSPPEREVIPGSPRPGPGLTSGRSATPTSTPSPKKRQLPQIPVKAQHASRDKVTQDLEERARQMKMKMSAYRTPVSHMSDSETMYRPRSRDRDRMDGRISSRDRINRRDMDYDHGRDHHDRGHGHGQGHGYHGHRSRRRGRHEFSPEVSDDAIQSDASETSDMSEVSKISTISVKSTQSEKPRRKLSQFTTKMEQRALAGSSRRPLNRSYSNTDVGGYEKNDGSISDSAISSNVTKGRTRRPSIGYKVAALVGLSRKSNSTSQLSSTGGKKPRASFQRSEEVGAAAEMRNRMIRQASKDSTDGSIGSMSSDSSSAMWLPSGIRLGPEGQFGDFIEGLGPSQLVGRQVLGSPCLGEIQLGLFDRKGHLEVEVIRARGLMAKAGAKILPAPYVKVYLMEGKNCVEKQKSKIARRTLDPLYQEQLLFSEPYRGSVLQVGPSQGLPGKDNLSRWLKVTVWGDYGRMDRKVFMGVAQILLDDLDLSNIVIGWYKLFTSSSLVSHHTHSRRNSGSSLESAYQSGSVRS